MQNIYKEHALNEILSDWFKIIYPVCIGNFKNPEVQKNKEILKYYLEKDMWNRSGCCQLKEQIDKLTTKLTIIEVEHAVNNKTFDGKETNISKLTNLYEDYCSKLSRVLFDYGAGLGNIKHYSYL